MRDADIWELVPRYSIDVASDFFVLIVDYVATICYYFLVVEVGLVVASATVEQEVLGLGSIPGSSKELLGFNIRSFSNSHGIWLAPYYMGLKKYN